MRTLASSLAVAALTACGSATPDVAAYQQSVSELQAAVAAHEADAAATFTAEACAAEHRRYDDMVRPRLQRLASLSAGMDRCEHAMGHLGAHPFESMCGSMQTELDRHTAVACAGDTAANHAEAAMHCRAMRDWLSEQQAQASSMSRMGGMMGRCGR